ncbi:hypothetical protein EJ08DRAFT_370725 [Tothia fuscella]|uniref:Uncharacterized protein n=1 Tax=Tothia fuscella TaxID=1048955 RepID=A0A9P4NLM6_9PEZI|nr:hypothetical protein EJ08DRAFT_370725 [Tothia fuscella]
MIIPPHSAIAQWLRPNYKNPHRQDHAYEVLFTQFLVFATLMVMLRFSVRIWVSREFGCDDAFCLMALILVSPGKSAFYVSVHISSAVTDTSGIVLLETSQIRSSRSSSTASAR